MTHEKSMIFSVLEWPVSQLIISFKVKIGLHSSQMGKTTLDWSLQTLWSVASPGTPIHAQPLLPFPL